MLESHQKAPGIDVKNLPPDEARKELAAIVAQGGPNAEEANNMLARMNEQDEEHPPLDKAA